MIQLDEAVVRKACIENNTLRYLMAMLQISTHVREELMNL